MTHLATGAGKGPEDDKNTWTDALLEILVERSPQLFGSAITSGFGRAALKEALIAGSSSERLASMKGKRIVIVDDTGSVLREALPLLIGATGGSAQAVWVEDRGLGQQVYSKLTPRGLAEIILAAKPEWVLMDWELRCGFYGTDVVDQLRRLSPDTPCIGFSSMSEAFNRSPVVSSVHKNEGKMIRSLEGVARVITEYAPKAKDANESPLVSLVVPPDHQRTQPLDLLMAISIMCQGYLFAHGTPEHRKAIGFEDVSEFDLETDGASLMSSPQVWSEALVSEDTISKLNNEEFDATATKTVVEFLSGLCRGEITEIRLETVAAMYREIHSVLGG